MLRKFSFFLASVFIFLNTFSQTDSTAPKKPELTITGSADLYYRYDFGKTKVNNLTSFTNSHNSFELGMASLKIENKTSKIDMVADLGFGKRVQEFAYNDQGILAAVKQLYISYSPNTWLKLTGGSWATHVGYEVLDAYANRNYSMSYMFTYGPFSHTGFKAEVAKGKNGFMLGVANATDFRYVPSGQINKKFLLAQYSYTAGDKFKLYFNYVGGQNIDTCKSNQFDVVITSKITSKFNIGFNSTLHSKKTYEYNSEKLSGAQKFSPSSNWWGSAIYLNLDPTPKVGLTLRAEYFDDSKSPVAIGGNVFATTLSANFKVDNFIFIPEFRIDNASVNSFVKADRTATKSAASVLLAAIYSF